MISERTVAGMQAAKRRGRHVGWPPKLTPHKIDHARELKAATGGMVLITLPATEEVRAAAFDMVDSDIDADMVAVAETIIKRRSGHFDPTVLGIAIKRRCAS